MKYGLIDETGILVQVQPYDEPGFVRVPDDAVPGQVTTDGGVTFVDPPKSLNEVKAEKKEEIKAAYEQALAAGFVCSNGIRMDATPDAVQLLDGGVRLALKAKLTTIPIRDYDNVVHPDLPVTDVDNMVTELAANVQTQLAKKWALQTQVDAATTVEEVDAITW